MANDRNDAWSGPGGSENPPLCFDCADNGPQLIADMFANSQARRIALGQKPAERAVFRKFHGAANGALVITQNGPGIFNDVTYPVWVRFSSDTQPTSPDLRSTIGIAIKMFLPDHTTADLIMQNHDVFFVKNAQEMCEFTYAGVVNHDYASYLETHPAVQDILNAMAKIEDSVLTATYWGILPFKFGNDAYVKYKLVPRDPRPADVANYTRDYLSVDLRNRLMEDEYCIDFCVQRQLPEELLDDATQSWKGPWEGLGSLYLYRQDICAPGQPEYGQQLSFDIWRTLPDNQPADESSIAQARKLAYPASRINRRTANGQPDCEPTVMRTIHRIVKESALTAGEPALEPSADQDTCIVKAAIYPPIGVARIGDATGDNDYFLGPEVTDAPADLSAKYRNGTNQMLRQAARFRIYGLNAEGEIVRELTGDPSADITWSVQVANTKAAWYTFQLALDIPEAGSAPQTTLRNADVADRTKLAIRPSARQLHGADAGPARFDDGSFMDEKVYLGEIRTDDKGRLIFLGGRGVSAPAEQGMIAITFANNDGWHDDVSDGPVTATLKYNDQDIEVYPAWVIVAPPNYAPERKSVRTMWDLMRDTAIKAGMLVEPDRPSFCNDILPILQRMTGLQWVNEGFAASFGWKGAFDFTTTTWIARLGDSSATARDLRRSIYLRFRDFDVDSWSPKPWPWLYGDAMNIPPVESPRQHATLTETQLSMLKKWADGNFEPDYDPSQKPYTSIDQVSLAEQGDMLTRAALDYCLADAFHPGCEMTWPVRSTKMYMAPFRFQHLPVGFIQPSLGAILNADALSLAYGPLGPQGPGGITRWMAVPWQTDTASCRSGYVKTYDPFIPTFWPARVPNQVLTPDSYDIVMNASASDDDRLAAFASRASWFDQLGAAAPYTEQINKMIANFGMMGLVAPKSGPTDERGKALFPPIVEVVDSVDPLPDLGESKNKMLSAVKTPPGQHRAAPGQAGLLHSQPVDLFRAEKFNRFPYGLIRR